MYRLTVLSLDDLAVAYTDTAIVCDSPSGNATVSSKLNATKLSLVKLSSLTSS